MTVGDYPRKMRDVAQSFWQSNTIETTRDRADHFNGFFAVAIGFCQSLVKKLNTMVPDYSIARKLGVEGSLSVLLMGGTLHLPIGTRLALSGGEIGKVRELPSWAGIGTVFYPKINTTEILLYGVNAGSPTIWVDVENEPIYKVVKICSSTKILSFPEER